MRIIMIVVLLAGLFIAGTAFFSKYMTETHETGLVCSIGHLKNEQNIKEVQRAEQQAIEYLYWARDSFDVLTRTGLVIAALGLIGACIKQKQKRKEDVQPSA